MSLGTGKYMNPRDGDVVEISLWITDEGIAPETWTARGCASINAVTRELFQMVRMKTAEEAAHIEARELIDRLRLDVDHERCALTAIAALRAALVDAHVRSLA